MESQTDKPIERAIAIARDVIDGRFAAPLVEGFFEPVVSRVPVASVRKQLWATVQRKLAETS